MGVSPKEKTIFSPVGFSGKTFRTRKKYIPFGETPQKGDIVKKPLTLDQIKSMTDEEIEAYNRRMTKRFIITMVIWVGSKAVLYYAINRAAKRAFQES